MPNELQPGEQREHVIKGADPTGADDVSVTVRRMTHGAPPGREFFCNARYYESEATAVAGVEADWHAARAVSTRDYLEHYEEIRGNDGAADWSGE